MRLRLITGPLLLASLFSVSTVTAKPGRRATTTYRTRVMRVLPVKVTNHNHLYEFGRGSLAIGKGTNYTLQVGALKLRVGPGLGKRLERWMFRRHYSGNKRVVRTTRATDGSFEFQTPSYYGVREANGRKIVSRGGKTTISEPKGIRALWRPGQALPSPAGSNKKPRRYRVSY